MKRIDLPWQVFSVVAVFSMLMAIQRESVIVAVNGVTSALIALLLAITRRW